MLVDLNTREPDSTPTGPASTTRLNVLLLCVSVCVGVALFEIGVRTLGFHYNLSPNWRYQPVLGWSQIPNATYHVVIHGHPVRVSFNSMGFRDIEHARAKPPHVKRIVVIGDSFCEAVQVNLEETFFSRLQELLNEGGSTRWEVINLGVGDFGTAQEYIALQQYGLAFDPDVVVQEVFPLNDPCNNALGLYDLCKSPNDGYRPYFVERDGDLRLEYAQPIRTILRHHLVAYNVIEYWLVKVFGTGPHPLLAPGWLALVRTPGFKGLDPLLYTYVAADEQPEPVAQGWRMTELLIERIVHLTRERGIAYVGLVAPFEKQVDAAAWTAFARAQPPPAMNREYPERRLGALFARLGVPSVTLLDEFQPYLAEVLPYIDGHLSAAGHRRAAEALYRKFVRAGLVSPSRRGSGTTALTGQAARMPVRPRRGQGG